MVIHFTLRLKHIVHCLFLISLFFAFEINGQDVRKDYLLGKVNQQEDSRFIILNDLHTAGSARGQYLRKETYEAFKRMSEAAKKDNVQLVIISATRNFFQQKAIWERKWQVESAITSEVDRAKKILLYSSMPGTSRHHWGTDMDLNNLNNDYFESGEGLKIYNWLTTHAHKFGFCQPYTSKVNGRTGYEEEKWHWSYTLLSNQFLKTYKATIKTKDILGFLGCETAAQIDVIKNYVDGVSCK